MHIWKWRKGRRGLVWRCYLECALPLFMTLFVLLLTDVSVSTHKLSKFHNKMLDGKLVHLNFNTTIIIKIEFDMSCIVKWNEKICSERKYSIFWFLVMKVCQLNVLFHYGVVILLLEASPSLWWGTGDQTIMLEYIDIF